MGVGTIVARRRQWVVRYGRHFGLFLSELVNDAGGYCCRNAEAGGEEEPSAPAARAMPVDGGVDPVGGRGCLWRRFGDCRFGPYSVVSADAVWRGSLRDVRQLPDCSRRQQREIGTLWVDRVISAVVVLPGPDIGEYPFPVPVFGSAVRLGERPHYGFVVVGQDPFQGRLM